MGQTGEPVFMQTIIADSMPVSFCIKTVASAVAALCSCVRQRRVASVVRAIGMLHFGTDDLDFNQSNEWPS